MTIIRPAAVAGMFYPADPGQAQDQLRRCFAQARPAPADETAPPKAIIAPHAGWAYSGAVAASAYQLLVPARGRIGRVVLLGPSHRVAFRGLAVSGAQAWASPLGSVAVDETANAHLRALSFVCALDAAHAQEHALEVHVPFLQTVLGSFRLVPVVVGDASPAQVATVIDTLWGGDETLIVVSTDLSHYLDYPSAQALDARTNQAIETLDGASLARDQACGRVPVAGLLLTAKRRTMRIRALDLRNSGDTAGGRDRVVGYGAWALYEDARGEPGRGDPGPDPVLGGVLVAQAWAAIRAAVAGTAMPAAADATTDECIAAALAAPGAVFVTLKRANGALRGCIGSPLAWRPLLVDLRDNAVKAATRDPRFPRVGAAELDDLRLSVSLLTPPQPMRVTDQADLLAQLRPGIDGLMIEDGAARALFLPSVWEQLPDPERFLSHLRLKAGLAPDHWSAGLRASRFQAVEFKDETG